MQFWKSGKNFIIHYFTYTRMGDDLYHKIALNTVSHYGKICTQTHYEKIPQIRIVSTMHFQRIASLVPQLSKIDLVYNEK